MGDWMDTNHEGIHDSNAWDVWGEGSVIMKPGNLGPDQAKTPYTAKDIRFTARGDAVYAWLMAWPENGQAVIRSLATPAGTISDVGLLGSKERLVWRQTNEGLVVTLPPSEPCRFAYGLKIQGADLKTAPLAR